MKQIGYVNLSVKNEIEIKQQIIAMTELGIEKIIYETSELTNLKKHTELVIYDLKNLGKTLFQLEQFLTYLNEKSIVLTIVNKNSVLYNLSTDFLLPLLLELADGERNVIRERTMNGLTEARRKGRVGGRPKVSAETIERIRYLYHNQSYNLRKIAEECGVSLGTAYKYSQSD